MTDPPPITACLSQAGPFRTAARLKIRTDGYFMKDVRELARSARGIAAPFAHPRLVSLGEFTTTRAMTDAANAQTQWTVAEPAANEHVTRQPTGPATNQLMVQSATTSPLQHMVPLLCKYQQPDQLTHGTPPKPPVHLVHHVRRTPTPAPGSRRDSASQAHGTRSPH